MTYVTIFSHFHKWSANNVIAKLFADDTTFFEAGENLDKLFSTFSLTILLNGVSIKVVRKFKLLGVILDDKILFNKHIASIYIKINFRLYSIKKLFY